MAFYVLNLEIYQPERTQPNPRHLASLCYRKSDSS